MPLVKITRSRQISIPKALFDELELVQGDYLEITRNGDELVLRPKRVVDRERQEAKAELGRLLDEIWEGNEGVDPDEVQAIVAKTIEKVRTEKQKANPTQAQ